MEKNAPKVRQIRQAEGDNGGRDVSTHTRFFS